MAESAGATDGSAGATETSADASPTSDDGSAAAPGAGSTGGGSDSDSSSSFVLLVVVAGLCVLCAGGVAVALLFVGREKVHAGRQEALRRESQHLRHQLRVSRQQNADLAAL